MEKNQMPFHECPICEKKFYGIAEWAYKKQVNGSLRYFCSWTCFRAPISRIKKKGSKKTSA